MAKTYKLTLDPIVNVNVNLSLKAATRKAFNLGLIIGDAEVIGEEERVRIFTSAAELLSAGYSITDAEYKAALLYFNASSKPKRLALGRRLEGETALQAVTACRNANSEWYVAYVAITGGLADSDIMDIAEYIESAQPTSTFFYTTNNSAVLSTEGEDDDIFIKLHEKLYRRTLGVYCGQEDTPDAAAAIMGYAMGANTKTANSAYTLAYKYMTGVTTDDLSQGQVEYITKNCGNCYVTRAEEYNIFQQGYMADKTSFDEILNLDMLQNEIQLSVMDLLYQRKKLPQTEAGVTSIINAINVACNQYVNFGFIAPGQWNGEAILELAEGDYLPDGYLVQAESIDDQPQADRDARKAPNIYVAIKLAGAIEFVVITVDVNR